MAHVLILFKVLSFLISVHCISLKVPIFIADNNATDDLYIDNEHGPYWGVYEAVNRFTLKHKLSPDVKLSILKNVCPALKELKFIVQCDDDRTGNKLNISYFMNEYNNILLIPNPITNIIALTKLYLQYYKQYYESFIGNNGLLNLYNYLLITKNIQLQSYLKNITDVFIVGCNIGQEIEVFTQLTPNKRQMIHCFEPMHSNLQILYQHIYWYR